MIIYGVLASVSIGDMFIAGIVPGLLMGVACSPAGDAGQHIDGQQQKHQPGNDGQDQAGDADDSKDRKQRRTEAFVKKGHGAVNAGVVHSKSP